MNNFLISFHIISCVQSTTYIQVVSIKAVKKPPKVIQLLFDRSTILRGNDNRKQIYHLSLLFYYIRNI